MEISTQRNPFKPFFPSPLWFTRTSLRSSPSIRSSSSLQPFSTSPEAFHRHKLAVLMGQNTHSRTTARVVPGYKNKRNELTDCNPSAMICSCSHVLHVPVSVPRLRSQNRSTEISRQVRSPVTQMARNYVQCSESLAGRREKLQEFNKQKLSDLPGNRLINATEGGSLNVKAKAISDDLNGTHIEPIKEGEECATTEVVRSYAAYMTEFL